jgi:IS1 family transposase
MLDTQAKSLYHIGMNRLPATKRAQILSLLCEGSSMRTVARHVDVSLNTVARELVLAGEACAAFHDRAVRNVQSQRVQADEIWSFCSMKEKQAKAKGSDRPANVGDVWTWTAIDADSKLIISWFVGSRDAHAAYLFMTDLASRLAHRIQLTTDGHTAYLGTVDAAFDRQVDYAMIVKKYGTAPESEKRYSPPICLGADKQEVRGLPDPQHISTSYVERANLTMRMHMRRYTRLTNAFSKKFDNHCHMVALYTVWYNFVRLHKTLRVTPAMAAGVTDHLMGYDDLVAMIDQWDEANNPPKPRGPYKKRAAEISN